MSVTFIPGTPVAATPCRACKAPPGKPCTTKTGNPRTTVHHQRATHGRTTP